MAERTATLHPVVLEILRRRGFGSGGDLHSFLNPSFDSLESPFVFQDMAKAADRIRRAITAKEKVLIYGDYDVDGVTASAILYPALKKLGADVESHIPHRMKEGYGLNRASLEEWVKKGVKLVITVDNGITGVEEVKYLKGAGVDVILVDHHVPKDEVPPADAIISAAVNDGKGDPNLAACGLAFKLVWALTDIETARQYLDLVTVGTVADLAPVLGDNRILLKHGLKSVSNSRNLGLRALMDVAGIHRGFLDYRDLAFGLGPRINASGRMGSPINAFKLLTTENAMEARNLALILEEGNRDRQKVELEAFIQAARIVDTQTKPEHRHVLVVAGEGWHEGVLGIVAARLVERYGRPSIALSLKDGKGKGSGRSIVSFSLFEALRRCEDLFSAFGGHAQACGLSLKAENVAALRERLNQAAAGTGGDALAEDRPVEAELAAAEIDARLVRDLESVAPFGPGNPAPRFMTRGMRLKGEAKKRGKDTLQCWMTDAGGKITCEVIGFRAYERWNSAGKKNEPVDIVYRPALKSYNGIETIQLELESWA